MNTTLQKLKLNSYKDKLVLNIPAGLHDFDSIIFDTEAIKKKYDFIFVFIFSIDEFVKQVAATIKNDLLNPNGYLFFAYPKKGNKQYKEYIGRDDFFPSIRMDENGYVNGSSIKFNKMVAYNETFTLIGLKHQATIKKTSQLSQCVADYIDRIPDLQKHFSKKKEVLDLLNKLTPGYQRDWARYVYGVKTEASQSKHLEEMETILTAGYKSVDLWRRKKKGDSE